MEETGTGRGIRIAHAQEDGQTRVIEAHYDEAGTGRLDVVIDGRNVYLSEEETAFFLAWMATWYGPGEEEESPCECECHECRSSRAMEVMADYAAEMSME